MADHGVGTVGALTLGEPHSGETLGYRDAPGTAALERIIEELPSKPFLVGDEGVSMSPAGARTYLLVTRHDRYRENNQWHRRHQDDFCQALGLPPALKYQHTATVQRNAERYTE